MRPFPRLPSKLLSPIAAAVMAVTAAMPALAQEGDAQAVIDSQIKAFRSGAHDQAFSYATPGLRSMFGSTDNFTAMVKRGYMPIYGAREWRFGRVKSDGSKLLQEVLLTGPEGRSWVALYTMVRGEDGAWKIGGVRIVPGSELST